MLTLSVRPEPVEGTCPIGYCPSTSSGRTDLLPLLFCFLASSLPAAEPGRKPNVVMVFVDTLRADHVGCYGYARKTTPALDELARSGTVFENAFSQASWSLPSYATIFTSLYPTEHGVGSQQNMLAASWRTLAEILGFHGYDTAAFVGGGHLLPAFGMSRGFAEYDCPNALTSLSVSVEHASRWLTGRGTKPFFLFVHGYDCHTPYRSPPEYAEMYDPGYRGVVHAPGFLTEDTLLSIAQNRFEPCALDPPALRVEPPVPASALGPLAPEPQDWRFAESGLFLRIPKMRQELGAADREHVVAHYDGAVSWADLSLAQLLDALDRLGALKNTIVLVAGDHGEQLFERGGLGHGGWPYHSVLHVPLVVCGPGVARSRRVTDAVGLIDLAPTVVELAGCTPSHQHKGESLAPYLSAATPAPSRPGRAVFSSFENYYSVFRNGWHAVKAVGPELTRPMLFHPAEDPAERIDTALRHPQETKELSDLLSDWLEKLETPTVIPRANLSEGAVEMLRKAGYW